MKQLLVWISVIAITTVCAHAENLLSITVLKAERSGEFTYLLFSVENKSNQRFDWTRWSCVFFDRGEPVYEGQSTVENVPAHNRAVQRVIQGYGGPFDKIECRFMSSRPNVPETAEQFEPQGTRRTGVPQDDMGRFVSKVLGSTELHWKRIFAADGKAYRPPTVVLYRGTTHASCGGVAESAMGPFYCPADQKIYLDTSFFDEIATRFGGCDIGSRTCQFSQAYVIAYLVGYHVQNLLGILPKAQQAQRTADSKAAANHIQLQLQLQLEADCLAGIWGNRENEMLKSAGKPPFIQPGDVEAALRTAAAIGDDTLQGRGRDYAVPDPIIHASAEQRQRWFNTGFRSGSVASCNTFAAAQL